MNKIPFAVGQAAGVGISEVNADATTSVTSGGASVFAGLVISRRGKIGSVLRVTADNFQAVLGAAIHPRSGAAFEPLRHVETAVNGGDGYVVRVPAPGMKIPALTLTADTTMQELSVVATNFAPGTDPVLAAGAAAMIYIEDGDASADRTLSMEADKTAPGFYILTLNQVDAAGGETQLESHQISFNPDASSDMGSPAFLPTALENGSTRLRAVVADDVETQMLQITEGFDDMQFSGGTDGDLSAIATADYSKALTVLRKSMFTWTAVLSLGCYDPTILAALVKLAEDTRTDMFYDIHGAQLSAAAIAEAQSHSFGGSHQAARYYWPYTARDAFTGTNVSWGISCDAFVAKAKGVALVSDVGGWHYAPAGVSRAIIGRQNIKPIPSLDEIDREAFVNARINPVSLDKNGNMYIDDSLTTFAKNNYLRLQHISSLMNAIARSFYDVAEALKHEPDGITFKGLTDGLKDVLERFVAAEALVKPRDATQGTEPFVIAVVQKDIDLWEATWSVCPTGSSRRIVGKPTLLR
ncbi:phage tail protein [Pantoea eucrina]|uniref:phage tail protein n=1 Tax=Pantoea eucrina TaxID=472693 RepID=UPI0024B71E25|nr:phage tail protein [Pantoea eucrina]MDJ0023657.1 phage tail protein [Pantoea eucrina]